MKNKIPKRMRITKSGLIRYVPYNKDYYPFFDIADAQ
jgi:hypothetical protein